MPTIPTYKSQSHRLSAIAFPAMEAMALNMGLPCLPETIKAADVNVLNTCSIELLSFIIFYAHHYEADGQAENLSEIIAKWIEVTESDICKNTLYRARTEIFYGGIIGKKNLKCPRYPFGSRRPGKVNRTQLGKDFIQQQRERKGLAACKN